MHGANQGYLEDSDPLLNGKDLRIGIVQSRFNFEITSALSSSCVDELIRLNVSPSEIELITVPGALEIAIALQTLAKSGEFDALVALGCVIRGETYHFDLVANESARGVSTVALDYGIPIINQILTTENLNQANARKVEKGRDAAKAAIEMANLLLRQDVEKDDDA